MKALQALARSAIQQMKPYSSARSLVTEGEVFLDANEWAWSEFARYPEPQPTKLVHILAELYGVSDPWVLVSRGSDEAIDCLVRAFCEPHEEAIIYCPPTFDIYAQAARIQSVRAVSVPLKQEEGWALDLTGIRRALGSVVKIVFLCSPNNPTGQVIPLEQLRTVLEMVNGRGLVVVDEAYIEFSESISGTSLQNEYPNLVVLRTLSKFWSGAGLRIGTTIAHPVIIEQMKKVLAPYPIPAPIADLAIQHLSQARPPDRTLIQQERLKLTEFFKSRPFVKKVWPSEANFILLEVSQATLFVETLKSLGVIVRDRSSTITGAVRVTVGMESENSRLQQAVLVAEREVNFDSAT